MPELCSCAACDVKRLHLSRSVVVTSADPHMNVQAVLLSLVWRSITCVAVRAGNSLSPAPSIEGFRDNNKLCELRTLVARMQVARDIGAQACSKHMHMHGLHNTRQRPASMHVCKQHSVIKLSAAEDQLCVIIT